MSKKYLIDEEMLQISVIDDINQVISIAKEVEVLDYQKTKREYEDSIFLSFIDFVRSKNYLIVKIIDQ